ncbi:serine/threonine-protein kinase [Streptomyces sp. 891-h]|uniref:serine/threonine-protein kinase n=1 Tax=Streptomyces sp. 891-h TaxID=2720714 RepID=UPI00205A8263|nr:serine/threonine-protein kinase [Streptomyces sp. 891-h]UNZ21638.1 PQQ-binding-like beta-propeller repeat protein [Streptomyces sp. 891-h]
MRPLGPGDPVRLGPYRLIGVLGAGGMGQVYLGRDGSAALVAVKVLRPEFADEAAMVRRFVREAEMARAVTSEGVARVLAAHVDDGRMWIASEFLAGPTLEDAVQRHGPLGAAALASLGAALAVTLRDIHATGLVHRDFKPSNIVLTSAGPRVIDFGIARPEHGLTLTSTGQTPITPGYGSPEQALGRRSGPKADVFSLGAVLAYTAQGRPAFEGTHVAAVQYEVVHGEPKLDRVPAHQRALIAACLAKEPGQRPSPEEIAAGLAPSRHVVLPWRTEPWAHEIAAREETARRAATFPGDPPGRRDGTSRRRALALMSGGGALLATLGGGAYWLGAGRQQENAESTKPTGNSWQAEVRPEPTTQGETPQALWGPTKAESGTKGAATVLRCARDVVLVGGEEGLHAYGVMDGKPRWNLQEADAAAGCLTVSDALALSVDRNGRLLGIRPRDGQQLWSTTADAAHLLASEGAAAYCVTRDGRLRAVNLKHRETLWTVRSPARSTEDDPVRATAAHGLLVLCGTDGTVTAVRTRTGRRAWTVRGQSDSALLPAIHGRTVFLGGRSLIALGLGDGKKKWSRPSDSPSKQDAPGWTAATVSGAALYAADGTELRKIALSDGRQIWGCPLPIDLPPTDPPVVQARSVWIALDRSGGAGVMAVRARDGSSAWRYGAGPEGKLLLTAADKRVFVLRGEELTAMPVF